MVQAYVLMTVAVGEVKRIVEELRAIKGVASATPVTGPYDVIVLVEADDLGALNESVVEGIHKVKGVLSTCTAVAHHFS